MPLESRPRKTQQSLVRQKQGNGHETGGSGTVLKQAPVRGVTAAALFISLTHAPNFAENPPVQRT